MLEQTVKFTINDDVVDIPTMRSMPVDQYAHYAEYDLFWVDHHDVLRAVVGGYPIAVNQEQIDALIQYLQSVKTRMPSSKE